MIFSAETCFDDELLDYDICIIGTGPVGMTCASEFLKRSSKNTPRVLLLESSAQKYDFLSAYRMRSPFDENVQPIYQGETAGWLASYAEDYLTSSRLRGYGGTSNVWSGWCWPLEPHDFEECSYRNGLSWPIAYNDLDLYYKRAQNVCRLDAFQYDNPQFWIEKLKSSSLGLMDTNGSGLRTRIIQFNPINFRDQYHDDLLASEDVDLLQNANLIYFEKSTHARETNVHTAVVRTIENNGAGRFIRVKARHFILATGAIEATRLLLLSNLGNETGHLGKHFMEHPYLWVASRFNLGNIPTGLKNFYFPSNPLRMPSGARILATLVPTREFIEDEGIGSFRVLLGGAAEIPGTINTHWEQLSNEQSQLALSDEMGPDIFGQKRIKVQNFPSEIDRKTIRSIIDCTLSLLTSLAYVSDIETPCLTEDPWDWREPFKIVPGNHPMGTTRMSDSPEYGVVDKNCCLHGCANLYVVSSGVFPTGGYANPTMTLVALALRLADHLKQIWDG